MRTPTPRVSALAMCALPQNSLSFLPRFQETTATSGLTIWSCCLTNLKQPSLRSGISHRIFPSWYRNTRPWTAQLLCRLRLSSVEPGNLRRLSYRSHSMQQAPAPCRKSAVCCEPCWRTTETRQALYQLYNPYSLYTTQALRCMRHGTIYPVSQVSRDPVFATAPSCLLSAPAAYYLSVPL